MIETDDIITIDLSPQNNGIWGDYARIIVMQKGVAPELDNITDDEWRKGLMMEEFLHNELIRFAIPQTMFEELYYHMNSILEEKGFINLDFSRNLLDL